MSYSFREPEWPAVCECKYDEAGDEMNRENCRFHAELADSAAEEELKSATRKRRTVDVTASAA